MGDSPNRVSRNRRASTVAFVAGVLLVVGAVVGTVSGLMPDLVATLLGLVGVAAIVYGIATGALVALNVFDRDPPT